MKKLVSAPITPTIQNPLGSCMQNQDGSKKIESKGISRQKVFLVGCAFALAERMTALRKEASGPGVHLPPEIIYKIFEYLLPPAAQCNALKEVLIARMVGIYDASLQADEEPEGEKIQPR